MQQIIDCLKKQRTDYNIPKRSMFEASCKFHCLFFSFATPFILIPQAVRGIFLSNYEPSFRIIPNGKFLTINISHKSFKPN